ncbi:hypothetical protein C8J57DRAFT_1213204 [Mycena rebaudengoi]|nr:hypothetical protein C8J57DRAFT_1213204 [Mycena rebaudengoi]
MKGGTKKTAELGQKKRKKITRMFPGRQHIVSLDEPLAKRAGGGVSQAARGHGDGDERAGLKAVRTGHQMRGKEHLDSWTTVTENDGRRLMWSALYGDDASDFLLETCTGDQSSNVDGGEKQKTPGDEKYHALPVLGHRKAEVAARKFKYAVQVREARPRGFKQRRTEIQPGGGPSRAVDEDGERQKDPVGDVGRVAGAVLGRGRSVTADHKRVERPQSARCLVGSGDMWERGAGAWHLPKKVRARHSPARECGPRRGTVAPNERLRRPICGNASKFRCEVPGIVAFFLLFKLLE